MARDWDVHVDEDGDIVETVTETVTDDVPDYVQTRTLTGLVGLALLLNAAVAIVLAVKS